MVTRKERVCGYPCPAPAPLAQCCAPGALSSLVCLGQVRGWGQGAAGQGHSLQLGHVWQCTEPRCLSQWAPCPQPETLRRRPCQPRELGGGGSTPDPRAPAGPASSPPLPGPSWSPLSWPSFCGPMFHVFRACGPQEGLESNLPELQNLTSLGVRWPCPPGLLHHPPLPGRPLPYPPLPALSIRRLSQDTPITSPQPSCGPWSGRSVPSAGGSGVSPGEPLVLWLDAAWRSTSLTRAGAEPAERRRWCGSRARGPRLWPGRAARGRQAPGPRARGFPRASRAPSQPWPRAQPQPQPFLPAPGHAGCRAENTALTLARRGRGQRGQGTLEEGGGGQGGGSGGSGWAP